MVAFCITSGVAIFGSLVLILLDRIQLGGLLDASFGHRKALLAKHQEQTSKKEQQKAPCYSYAYIAITAIFLALSWALYIAITIKALTEEEESGSGSGSGNSTISTTDLFNHSF